ncbi:MAG TPA: DNA-binding protein [Clostridia bacterium]|nr:DNA-binding protein [Clostridia bacterium]
MHQKTVFLIIALLLLFAPAAALADGNAVSSNDLIDHAKDYDNQTVVYEGEVLGDILYRGDHAWLAVYDGSNTIGIYVTAEQAQQITVLGGYGKQGDTIRIEGVFHRACAEHGGDLDIHADTMKVLSVGSETQIHASRLITILAIALPLPAAGLLLLVWKKRAATKLNTRKTVPVSDEK